MRRFSEYICVDWSGAKTERPKGIAVATIAEKGAPKLIAPTPSWSRDDIKNWLLDIAANGQNCLIGFDLSMGLPYADEGCYFPEWMDSPECARDLWQMVDQISADDPYLGTTTFLRHKEAARHFRHSKGNVGDLFRSSVGRLRVAEHHQRATGQGNSASCFNLIGASQVGKSSLTGMRMLHQLGGAIPIWPFDAVPENGPVILEIYTTIAALAAGMPKGRSKVRDRTGLKTALAELDTPCPRQLSSYDDHSTDALITAAWMKQMASDPALWSPRKMTHDIAQKEGWTFGVI